MSADLDGESNLYQPNGTGIVVGSGTKSNLTAKMSQALKNKLGVL